MARSNPAVVVEDAIDDESTGTTVGIEEFERRARPALLASGVA